MQYAQTLPRTGVDRRRGTDRRNQGQLSWAMFTFSGQRVNSRRAADHLNCYVDRYDLKLFLVTVAITILCVLDAAFTLKLIAAGIAVEANPVMAAVMAHSTEMFLITKFTMTGLCLLLLVLHVNFQVLRIKVLHVLYGFLVMYAVLIKYELWLFSLGA